VYLQAAVQRTKKQKQKDTSENNQSQMTTFPQEFKGNVHLDMYKQQGLSRTLEYA